jgi:large-conductance mechanosensitive channel
LTRLHVREDAKSAPTKTEELLAEIRDILKAQPETQPVQR